MFGWLGLFAAESSRHGWLRCGHCDFEFRRPTSFLMRWFAWLILVSLATVGAYYVTYVMREPADAGHEDLPQPIINLLALAHDQPVAVFAAIAVMSVLMLLTIASLAIRLGGLRRTLWRERTDRDIALRRELWREREGIDTPEDAEPTSTD